MHTGTSGEERWYSWWGQLLEQLIRTMGQLLLEMLQPFAERREHRRVLRGNVALFTRILKQIEEQGRIVGDARLVQAESSLG
jgi:hypothetical protein